MTGVRPGQFAPVAIVSRCDVDESIHFGAVVGIDAAGGRALSVGDPTIPIYPRSSTKPFQALAMVRAGLDVPDDQLALVCASHNGEQVHQRTALDILAAAGLGAADLGNTADHPLHAPSAHRAIRNGIAKSSLQMNCSGKHSGMLATCVVNGWPLEGYLEPHHPLQEAVTTTITQLTGAAPVAIGTDGCGAPAHVVTLEGLARGMRAMATGAAGPEGLRVHRAMSGNPYLVGGDGRHVTALMQSVTGLMAKDGAESVYVAALADGRAVALKLSDGSGRGTSTVMVAALAELGVDVSRIPDTATERVLGHGKPVGDVRAVCFPSARSQG